MPAGCASAALFLGVVEGASVPTPLHSMGQLAALRSVATMCCACRAYCGLFVALSPAAGARSALLPIAHPSAFPKATPKLFRKARHSHSCRCRTRAWHLILRCFWPLTRSAGAGAALFLRALFERRLRAPQPAVYAVLRRFTPLDGPGAAAAASTLPPGPARQAPGAAGRRRFRQCVARWSGPGRCPGW